MRELLHSRSKILAATMVACIPDGDDAPAQRDAWYAHIVSEVNAIVTCAERDAYADGLARGTELTSSSLPL